MVTMAEGKSLDRLLDGVETGNTRYGLVTVDEGVRVDIGPQGNGFAVARLPADLGHHVLHVQVRVQGGIGDGEDDHSTVHFGGSQERLQGEAEDSGVVPADHPHRPDVDGIADVDPVRNPFLQSLGKAFRQPCQGEAEILAGIGHHDPSGPGDGQDAKTGPLHLPQEQKGAYGVFELHAAVDPQDARTPERRIENTVLPHEGSRMRQGCPGPGPASARLEDKDRFGEGRPGGCLQKCAAPADAFKVQGDDFRFGIVRQVFQGIHHVEIGSVADVDRLAPVPISHVLSGHLDDAGLGDQGDGREVARRFQVDEGRRKAFEVVHHPHRVGPEDSDSVLPAHGHDSGLHVPAGRIGIGKPLADDDDSPNARLNALLHHRDDAVAPHGDDGQINRIRHIPDGGVGLQAADRGGIGIDRVDPAPEAVAQHGLRVVVRPGSGLSRHADEGDGFRFQKLLHGRSLLSGICNIRSRHPACQRKCRRARKEVL